MSTINKQSCPTCGQSVNKRQISLFKGMVEALFGVYKWCKENNRHEFKKKDIEHLLSKSVQANFAYWRWFGGLAYNPDNIQGHYGLNMERCEDFFTGKLSIPTVLLKNPLEEDDKIEKFEYKYISEIPHLSSFLDENKNFIAQYMGSVEFGEDGQGRLI